MKITFLGTGTSQGIPVITCPCEVCTSEDPRDQRLRTALLIEVDGLNIAIDTGPDFRQQMLKTKINRLDAICITHEHNDHIIGLDDIRPFNFRAKKDMAIYATQKVQQILKDRFAYIFEANPYPGAPRVQLHEISKDQDFIIENTTLIPIEVMHGNLPVLGFRIKNFCYITDAKTITEIELDKIRGCRYLVLNALREQEHHSHLSLAQALSLIQEIKPEKAWLTHISHRMGLTKTVEQLLPENVNIAHDFLTLEL